MLLYHFTCEDHLERILAKGISRGDVPTSPTGGFNAPWLTNNTDPHQQGWQYGGETRSIPGFVDKTVIRFTVKIPRGDRNLIYWSKFAKKRLDPEWYKILDKAGGGGSKNWYIYRGMIPVDWIVEIGRRGPDGDYQPT